MEDAESAGRRGRGSVGGELMANVFKEKIIMDTFHINEIDLFSEPRRTILQQLPKIKNEPEMSEFESSFLCGLLKKHKPHKIVEVGVAGGGTTAIILQCMAMLGIEDFEMHSIDYSERFYRDSNYQSGFLGNKAKEIIGSNVKSKHHFHFGDIAASFMEEIGEDIDFLILDTMHRMPGEVLDFISLLPYLKVDAVVVLHDIALNQYSKGANYIATGQLFSSVVADKYINYDTSRKGVYPNIGAFIINEDTKKYIINSFLSLSITWGYKPDKRQITGYKTAIKNHYTEELLELFEMLAKLNIQRKASSLKDRFMRAVYVFLRGN